MAWRARRASSAGGSEFAALNAVRAENTAYYITVALITFGVVVIHALVAARNFSDYDGYLFYLDQLIFFRSADWFYFEPFAKMALLALHSFTGDTVSAVDLAHYLISIVYILGMFAIFPPRLANWRGMLATFALFGPQLAFVTIRATPAYFIASVAVLHAVRGHTRAFAFVLLAVMFHISGVLALVPIVALFAQSRFPALRWLQKPSNVLRVLVGLALVLAFFGSYIFEGARALFTAVPFLAKYLIFTVGLSDSGGVANLVGQFAIGHFVLLGFVTVLVGAFVMVDDRATRTVSIFVITSYVLYVFTFLGFSPVAAFRQTPFWMIPAFAIFPWQKVGLRGIGNVAFILGCFGVFAFQFSRVLNF